MKNYIPLAILLMVICVAVYALMPAFADYRQARTQARELEEQLAELDVEMRDIGEELRGLKTDPRAVERVAREKFGWCRDNEKIYHFDKAVPRTVKEE